MKTYKIMMTTGNTTTEIANGFTRETAQIYINMCKSQDEAEKRMGYDFPEATYTYVRG